MTYSSFRTGLTFTDVRRELAMESQARVAAGQEPIYITRRTVLGRWRQHKLTMWAYFQRGNGAVNRSDNSIHNVSDNRASADTVAA